MGRISASRWEGYAQVSDFEQRRHEAYVSSRKRFRGGPGSTLAREARHGKHFTNETEIRCLCGWVTLW